MRPPKRQAAVKAAQRIRKIVGPRRTDGTSAIVAATITEHTKDFNCYSQSAGTSTDQLTLVNQERNGSVTKRRVSFTLPPTYFPHTEVTIRSTPVTMAHLKGVIKPSSSSLPPIGFGYIKNEPSAASFSAQDFIDNTGTILPGTVKTENVPSTASITRSSSIPDVRVKNGFFTEDQPKSNDLLSQESVVKPFIIKSISAGHIEGVMNSNDNLEAKSRDSKIGLQPYSALLTRSDSTVKVPAKEIAKQTSATARAVAKDNERIQARYAAELSRNIKRENIVNFARNIGVFNVKQEVSTAIISRSAMIPVVRVKSEINPANPPQSISAQETVVTGTIAQSIPAVRVGSVVNSIANLPAKYQSYTLGLPPASALLSGYNPNSLPMVRGVVTRPRLATDSTETIPINTSKISILVATSSTASTDSNVKIPAKEHAKQSAAMARVVARDNERVQARSNAELSRNIKRENTMNSARGDSILNVKVEASPGPSIFFEQAKQESTEIKKESTTDSEVLVKSEELVGKIRCSVCWDKKRNILDKGNDLMSTRCAHLVCHSCWMTLVDVYCKYTCPVCRIPLFD